MRLWWLAGLAVALCGCRADVEGMWEGTVGTEDASLSLEQKGSSITGEVCFGDFCDGIDDGTLDERSLVLTYGCGNCALPKSTLDLVLQAGLQGEQHQWSCDCTPEDNEADACMCRTEASFTRCQGSCGGR